MLTWVISINGTPVKHLPTRVRQLTEQAIQVS
jgi:hypothetical protein